MPKHASSNMLYVLFNVYFRNWCLWCILTTLRFRNWLTICRVMPSDVLNPPLNDPTVLLRHHLMMTVPLSSITIVISHSLVKRIRLATWWLRIVTFRSKNLKNVMGLYHVQPIMESVVNGLLLAMTGKGRLRKDGWNYADYCSRLRLWWRRLGHV